MKKRCKVCGKKFTPGVDGVVGDLCDKDAGVERDANGFVWGPGELEQTRVDINTGEKEIVLRKEMK